MADKRILSREIPLTGKLITSVDPSTIDENFQSLKNLRYTDTGLRGVGGMSVINSTPITTYTDILNGIHFINEHASTPTSHVIVQAFNSGDSTDSKLYENRTTIPSTGNFEATTLSSNASNSNIGNFSLGPDGTVVYCDSKSSQIWGGPEARCAGFINYDETAGVFEYDFSEVITNNKTDVNNIATITSAANEAAIYIGSVRPLKGFKLDLGVLNTTAATLAVNYWDGSSWAAVSSLTDNTFTGTETLSQDGTVTFTNTDGSAKVKSINTIVVYWYQVLTSVSIDSVTIIKCTVDASMQQVKDLWDGEFRSVGKFLHRDDSAGVWVDFTSEVFEEDWTSVNTSTRADISNMPAADHLVVGFSNRAMGLSIIFTPAAVTANPNTVLTLSYWNGTAWVSLTIEDGTSASNISFSQSGVVIWNSPNKNLEFKQSINNSTELFYYKLQFNEVMDANVWIDYISGITTPIEIGNYKFSIHAHNRLILCSDQDGNKNEALIGATDSSAVFNGVDSAIEQFGGSEELTAGIGLYRQFGSTLYNMFVFCKETETWILTGQDPENWIKYQASDTIGCIATRTMKQAHIGEVIPTQNRYVCIWQGAEGIYLFDGSVIRSIHDDIRDRFDPTSSTSINTDKIGDSFAFFDNFNQEYHWCFAAGVATTPDTELVYDIKRDKWYEVDRGSGEKLFTGFTVKDSSGNRYNYGAEDDGKLYRLENGTDFDGNDIIHEFQFGDIALKEGSINTLTKIRKVKLVTTTKSTTTNSVIVTHYGDGNTTGTSLTDMSPVKSGYRIANVVKGTNAGNYTFHSLKFSMTTNDETVGFEPVFVGIIYNDEGLDLN